MVDQEEEVERHFSVEELRKLFVLNEDTSSDTHDKYVTPPYHLQSQILVTCMIISPGDLTDV